MVTQFPRFIIRYKRLGHGLASYVYNFTNTQFSLRILLRMCSVASNTGIAGSNSVRGVTFVFFFPIFFNFTIFKKSIFFSKKTSAVTYCLYQLQIQILSKIKKPAENVFKFDIFNIIYTFIKYPLNISDATPCAVYHLDNNVLMLFNDLTTRYVQHGNIVLTLWYTLQ